MKPGARERGQLQHDLHSKNRTRSRDRLRTEHDGKRVFAGKPRPTLPSSNRRCRFSTSGSPENSRLKLAQAPIRTDGPDKPVPTVGGVYLASPLAGDRVSDCAAVDAGSGACARTSRFPSTRQSDTQRKSSSPILATRRTHMSLLLIKRVEEELIRGVRLAPPLRLESQQNHVAFAHFGIERCDLAFEPVGSGQIAAG